MTVVRARQCHNLLHKTQSHHDVPIGLVSGHPRLRRDAIEAELSELFDIEKAYEGVYDMDLSGTTVRHLLFLHDQLIRHDI